MSCIMRKFSGSCKAAQYLPRFLPLYGKLVCLNQGHIPVQIGHHVSQHYQLVHVVAPFMLMMLMIRI